MFTLAFFSLLVVAWSAAYLWFIRPWLKRYRLTAGIYAELDAREHTLLTWLELKLRGLKTVGVLFCTSIFSGAFDAVQTLLGLDPSDLAPFQDSALWKALVGDDVAIKAAAVATFGAALLLLKGKLRDAATVPQADPAEIK